MRVAVIGATGRIGVETTTVLRAAGHDVVPVSRSSGIDIRSGTGVLDALSGADAVIDTSNTPAQDEAEIVDFFATSTANLLAAEQAAAVRHHVVLSIVGIDHGQPVPHYAGKRAQEQLVTAGPIPYTIVRATQFHDFAAMVAGWAEQDGVATIAPLLVQPIAPSDVGTILADIATGPARNDCIEIAGPRTEDLVDMARRTLAARGDSVELVPTWRGIFDTSMSGEVLLPGRGARLGTVRFDEWLATA